MVISEFSIHVKKSKYLLFALFIGSLWFGCEKNNNISSDGGNTEIDSLIYYHDSLSNYTPVTGIDTVYTDTTIKKLKFKYDLTTNDPLPDSAVSSGFYVSGFPSVAFQTFGKYNTGHIDYTWIADSSLNYLHIGFDIGYELHSQFYIRMYNIRIYKIL